MFDIVLHKDFLAGHDFFFQEMMRGRDFMNSDNRNYFC